MSIPKELLTAAEEARRRLASGDPKGTIHIGEQILQHMPKFAGVHALLARAYRQTGEADKALARFRSAAELSPGDPARWFEFVNELLRDGQKGRARKVAQKAPLKGPNRKELLDLARKGVSQSGPSLGGADPDVLRSLKEMIQKGEGEQARQKAEALLETHPNSAFLYNILGIVALTNGDNEAAEKCFRKTLDLSPDFGGAAANLGLALTRQRRFGPAIEVLKSALAIEPHSIEARMNLANAYLDAEMHEEAFDVATEILNQAKGDLGGLKIHATSSKGLKRYDMALGSLDRIEKASGVTDWSLLLRFEILSEADRVDEARDLAERNAERFPIILTPLARLVAQLGEIDEARRLLRKAIESNPDDASAYFHYGAGKRWTEDDDLLRALIAAAERAPETRRGEFALYALAKAKMDLGEDDEVFPLLDKANELQGSTGNFDWSAQENLRRNVEERWGPETFERLRDVGVESASPIFIVGMPRSGSTLLEHVIAAHPAVTSIGEDSFTFPYFPIDLPAETNALVEASEAAAKEVRRLAGPEGRLLDKFLYNFQRLGILAAAFPDAKFVQTEREPRAIALSIYANPMDVRVHPYSTNLEDIARFYMHYHAFMRHWRNVLGDRIIVSDYQELVENPEREIRSLIDRLGLSWDDACLRPDAVQKRVKTLSVVQVRSGIHAGSVERWKRHEQELEPFSRVLREAGLL